MARVKDCPVCRYRNDAKELFCTKCGSSLADVTAHDGTLGETAEETSGGGDTGTTLEPAHHSHPRAALEFAWGRVEVDARLAIGRDAAFSPIAANLGEFVSRRHAEVLLEGGKLFVRHLGQTNPTYVNGRKLGDSERTELADGDELGFSTQEIAVVRIGART